MEQLVIREVTGRDNDPLAKIIRQVIDEHRAPRLGTVYSDPTTDNLSSLFREPGSVLWVAEWEGAVVGCCGIYPTHGLEDGCAELVKFYLQDLARGKGIGKSLLLQCIQSARELGYGRLYLESLPAFSKAVSMYEKLGFYTLDAPRGNSGHTSCDIWMMKEL